MSLRSILAVVAGLLFATSIAAQAPAPTVAPPQDPENVLLLDLSTGGRVAIQLRPDVAPRHVERIKTLVRENFYNGVTFHRVIEGFMAQTGDPTGTGEGGSKLPDLEAEFSTLPHLRGTVSMARTNEPNSANSQFFIMFVPRFTLDGKYTVLGRVISGMNYVDAIARGEPPSDPSRILRASIAADNIPPPVPGEVIPTPSIATSAPAAPPGSSPAPGSAAAPTDQIQPAPPTGEATPPPQPAPQTGEATAPAQPAPQAEAPAPQAEPAPQQ